MSFRESNMNAAVIEQLREIVGRAFEDMQEIVGGFDLLPQAFFRRLRDRVRFGAAVNAIEQDEHGVTVHHRSPAGRFSVRGDHCIVAIPFSVLRDIEVAPAFSRPKQRRSASSTTTRAPRSCSRPAPGSGSGRTAS
jgi:monoamine oxidase